MEDILNGLNESQLAAVTATEGYVRVIAGAGSGKTRALTHRFAWLVNDLGILPGNILCVTFTNKAANEMRQRIHQLTGDDDTGYISTFHGFCVSVLKEDSHAVQYPKNFLVLDNADIDDMLKIIYEERGLTLRDMTYGQARDMIEMQKLFRKPEYYLDMLQMSPEALLAKYHQAQSTEDIIFYGYLYQEKKCFGLDYNDLIKVSLYIFHENPEIRLKWQKRLEYIMIDEFQDIDGLQYELMEVLCGYHHNLFIVGDPDQTIYTWRGANVRYLLDFPKNFPGARTIMMVQNYRSTPEILSASNSLIEKNRDRIRKDLLPELPAGSPVLCHFADTAEKEAEWIALSAAKLHEDGVAYRDMTILYRAHYITRSVEEVFLKAQIPYTIYSGVQFFQRMEIKDALAYLRMIAYRDDLSFRRIANVPKRNIGNRRMKYLEEYTAVHGGSLFDALCACLEEDIFRGTKAKEFVKLIREFSASSPGRAVSEVLSDILDKSGYEKMLRTRAQRDTISLRSFDLDKPAVTGCGIMFRSGVRQQIQVKCLSSNYFSNAADHMSIQRKSPARISRLQIIDNCIESSYLFAQIHGFQLLVYFLQQNPLLKAAAFRCLFCTHSFQVFQCVSARNSSCTDYLKQVSKFLYILIFVVFR